MTAHNKIEGVFRLNSPLHCASPEKASEDNKTLTVTQSVVTSRGQQTIPYFPGNDIRGRLRRKAAKVVLDTITQSSKITALLYAGLCTGAVSASPESNLTVEVALRAKKNVYMGIFGGGTRLLPSRFQVNDLVPILDETIESGMVPAKLGATDDENFVPQRKEGALQGWQLLQYTQILRVNEFQRMLRPEEMMQYIDNPIEVISRIQAEMSDQNVKRKAAKVSAAAGDIKKTDIPKKLNTHNIASFQSISAGTPMYLLLNMNDDTTDAHVGLLLLCMKELVREQRLGGWSRAGCGRFDATLTLTRHGESMPVFAEKRASADAEFSAQAQVYVDAANAEIKLLTEPELMAFFEAREDAKEEIAA